MSFKSVLESVSQRLDGVLGAVVIAEDGIIVDRHFADESYDTELASVEYIGGCRHVQRAAEAIESGALEEVAVVAEKTVMLMRTISPGYLILVMMKPGSSLGRGRYELKRASYELAPEFL